MPTARRTRRRGREPKTALSVVIALVVHGTIIGTVSALGLSVVHGRALAVPPLKPPVADDDELKATCFDDAALATSGRYAMCLAPWVGDVDACWHDVEIRLWIDLSACQARNDPGTAVAMLEPRAAARLRPIDPERLLDEVKPEPKPPAPPKPQPPAAAAVTPPPPPPPPARSLPQQVVETVKPSEEKEPDNARFLAEYNTKVEKQTVARGSRSEPLVAKSKPEELTAKDKPKDEPSVTKPPDREVGKNEHAPDVPGRLSMRNPGALFPSQSEQEAKVRGAVNGSSGASAADGYLARKGDGETEQQRRERTEAARGQGGAGGGAPPVLNLRPTQEVLERVVGGGSVDHLEDVDNGDETSLSAKRWIYASFFNRLKRQVAQNWDPNSVWRRVDPTGSVYGNKSRVTEVRVSLSPKGELAKILVTSPSGSTELDEEAVRAFRVAAPFPNPPSGLVQKDNLITFSFGFYFQLGSPHLSWRLPEAL